jgi:Domain of unknown function (DUF222)
LWIRRSGPAGDQKLSAEWSTFKHVIETTTAAATLSGAGFAAAPAEVDVVAELVGLVDRLGRLPMAVDDGERIDRIAALEQLRSAVAAAQARETTEFAALQVAGQAAAGVPAGRRGRGIAQQVGYARRMSPAAAAREVTLAQDWQTDLPAVYCAMRAGRVSEWVARLIARETRDLPRQTRRRIAEDLCADLPGMSPRQAEAAARRMAYEADPQAVLSRARTARTDRRVSLRPAPDTMTVLSAFLPAEQGVAAWANLDRHARGLRAGGDPRTHGQLMADTLVERLTGQPTATAVPVEIGLTMTTDTLLDSVDADGRGTGRVPADLDGYGPLPADLALDLLANADTTTWVRRLFTDPVDDTIVHIDTRRRRFDGGLARLIRYRDRVCRDPYCTATIRHLDHVEPYRDGGRTSATNGAGLCERGNYVKDMPGWTHRVLTDLPDPNDPAGAHDVGGAQRIEVTTPTGHRYTSTPPPALGPGGNYRQRSRRAVRRRFEFLQRERLIATLPSPKYRPQFPPRRN